MVQFIIRYISIQVIYFLASALQKAVIPVSLLAVLTSSGHTPKTITYMMLVAVLAFAFSHSIIVYDMV